MPRSLLLPLFIVPFLILHSSAVLIIPIDDNIAPIFPLNLLTDLPGETALGPLAAMTTGALVALKGAAAIGILIAYALDDDTLVRRRRSAESLAEASAQENHVLNAVSLMDTHGCILKTVCLLQATQKEKRTPEEDVLVDLFARNLETFSGRVNGTEIFGSEGVNETSSCDDFFRRCSLDEGALRALLQQAWGCGVHSI